MPQRPRTCSWLDRRLRPTEGGGTAWSDASVIYFLAVLAVSLLVHSWLGLVIHAAPYNELLPEFVGQLVPAILLPALGVLLAMRLGAIDVSYWACFFLGAAAAVGLMNRGHPAWLAMLVGGLAGALPGAMSAVLVLKARLPGLAATAISAAVVFACLHAAMPAERIHPPEGAFAAFHLVVSVQPQEQPAESGLPPEPPLGRIANPLPLSLTRMLMIAIVYSMAMAAMLVVDRLEQVRRRRCPLAAEAPAARRGAVAAALVASAVLASAGGAIGLLELPYVAAPRQWLGDLRIPAAAVLAGGCLLAGRSRSLLAGVLLAPAMLISTAWMQRAWRAGAMGYELQVAALLVMALAVHLAGRIIAHAPTGRRWLAMLGGMAVSLGAGGQALSFHLLDVAVYDAQNLIMGSLAAAGGIAILAACFRPARASSPADREYHAAIAQSSESR